MAIWLQHSEMPMRIKAGYEISFDCPSPTPMLVLTDIHPWRRRDLITPQNVRFDPPIPADTFYDSFGNTCRRIVTPQGLLTVSTDFLVRDSGEPDAVYWDAKQHPIQDLPYDVLP